MSPKGPGEGLSFPAPGSLTFHLRVIITLRRSSHSPKNKKNKLFIQLFMPISVFTFVGILTLDPCNNPMAYVLFSL